MKAGRSRKGNTRRTPYRQRAARADCGTQARRPPKRRRLQPAKGSAGAVPHRIPDRILRGEASCGASSVQPACRSSESAAQSLQSSGKNIAQQDISRRFFGAAPHAADQNAHGACLPQYAGRNFVRRGILRCVFNPSPHAADPKAQRSVLRRSLGVRPMCRKPGGA